MLNLQPEIDCWSFMRKNPFTLNSHNFSVLCKVSILSHLITNFLARGYQLTFLNPKRDPAASLTRYEERQYDHIILFPQKLKGTQVKGSH